MKDKQPQTVSRWVKVSERLPSKTYNCFVRATRKHQGYFHNDTALFRLETKKWVFINPSDDLLVVEWLEELENVYLFTPEELEALKAEWQREAAEDAYGSGWDRCMSCPYGWKESQRKKYLDAHYPLPKPSKP